MQMYSTNIFSLLALFVICGSSSFRRFVLQITERHKGKLRLNIETLQAVVLFSIILFECRNRSAVISPSLTEFTVYNSSGIFRVPNTIIYYQGHLTQTNLTSYIHGTLYHSEAFEGVISLNHSTYYLEAVGRHKPSPNYHTILYQKDNVANFSEGMLNYPEIKSQNHTQSQRISRPYDGLFKKYFFRESPRIR